MKLSHSMLTGDILTKFENLYKKDFTEKEKSDFERNAFIACFSYSSYRESWKRFCELVKMDGYEIDLENMHNETVDLLTDFVMSQAGINRYNDDFDRDEIEIHVNVSVYCHDGDIESIIRESVRIYRDVQAAFAERDRRMKEQEVNHD